MRPLFAPLLCAAALCLAAPAAAPAAELVMFERAGCPWCEAFDREVAPIYPKTAAGKLAPLRRVDIQRPIPPDLAFLDVERITPVFVLIDGGREIGRIRGYPGEAHFWGLFESLVDGLPRPPPPAATENPLRRNG